jgi:hypothetical protein
MIMFLKKDPLPVSTSTVTHHEIAGRGLKKALRSIELYGFAL